MSREQDTSIHRIRYRKKPSRITLRFIRATFLFRKQRLDKLPRIKILQILNRFTHADITDGDAELLGKGEHHAAFGGSVQFGDGKAGQSHGLVKLLGLTQGILPSAAVQHQQHFVGRGGVQFCHDALDLGQFFHQVGLGV